jgi:hypothetical protein
MGKKEKRLKQNVNSQSFSTGAGYPDMLGVFVAFWWTEYVNVVGKVDGMRAVERVGMVGLLDGFVAA